MWNLFCVWVGWTCTVYILYANMFLVLLLILFFKDWAKSLRLQLINVVCSKMLSISADYCWLVYIQTVRCIHSGNSLKSVIHCTSPPLKFADRYIISLCPRARVCVCACVCVHTHTYIHIYNYVYMSLCVCVCVCVYTHTHTLFFLSLATFPR